MNFRVRNNQKSQPPLIVLLLFGAVFAGMGCLFCYLIVSSELKDAEIKKWPQAQAEVSQSQVKVRAKQDKPFELVVKYQYDWDGESYEGDNVSRSGQKDKDYTKLWLMSREFPAGAKVLAYVNPEDPAEAYLQSDGMGGTLLFVLLPLIFVVIGVGIMWAGISARANAKREAAGELPVSTQQKSKFMNKHGWLFGVLFGSVFFFIGLGVFYGVGLKGWQQGVAAKSWQETPCRVIWSKVRTHSGDDSTTYSVDVFYRYQWDGQSYRSNRYDFSSSSSSGYDAKRALADRYKKGSEHTCLVNPAEPWISVIDPDGGHWFGFIFGGIFALVGGGVMIASVAAKAKSRRQNKADGGSKAGNPYLAKSSSAAVSASGLVEQQLSKGRWGKVIGACFLALFWNGIVSVFLKILYDSWVADNLEIFLAVFLIPFVCVGIGFIFAAVLTIIELGHPKLLVSYLAEDLALGEKVTIAWKIPAGSAGRLKRMQIHLRGEERESYEGGRDNGTAVATEIFAWLPLLDTQREIEMINGKATIELPLDLMHSWHGEEHSVIWSIEVSGEIGFFPNMHDECEVEVLAPRIEK
ncbi:DUF3592 domain-containing protein [Persicirhabdus sediminis]|uniref:DUF3592 domain-containing protein n=1 Tax=Persicirhabdus sediminis TaxID=454144 RepID=A0A8J7MB17_9BACT|nr:DUF3592 domain-containing protein [Persicirhabdus sediminis]MBK1789619.1 DUF3592 domain-containing protein [Persicirhabdus sediminis]